MAQQYSAQQGYIVCPRCGTPNPPGTLYCMKCGAPLAYKRCPRCGAQVPINAASCPHCGYVFQYRSLASVRRTMAGAVPTPSGGLAADLTAFYNLVFKKRRPILNVSREVYATLPLKTYLERGKYVMAAAALFLMGVGLVLALASRYPVSPLVALIYALIPAGAYMWYIYQHDRFEPEPLWLVLFAFAWGVFSSIIALILNETIVAYLCGGFASCAAFTEEPSKFIGVYLLATLPATRNEFNDHLDGFLYGAMAGLGFGVAENVLYIARSFARLGMGIVLLRATTILMHMFTVGLAGWWLGYLKMTGRPIRIPEALVGMFYGMAIHFTWNLLGYIIGPAALLVVIIAGPAMLWYSHKILQAALLDEYYWGFAQGYAPRENYSSSGYR